MTAKDGGNASTAGAVLVKSPAFILYAVVGATHESPFFYLELLPLPL